MLFSMNIKKDNYKFDLDKKAKHDSCMLLYQSSMRGYYLHNFDQ